MSERPTNFAARRSLMLLWALSGFATLTLELVWMREMALWAGNTVVAATLVTAVFFACAAAGNLWGATLVSGRTRPLACYWRFEIAAAVLAAVSFMLCRWFWDHGDALPGGWIGRVLAAGLLVGPSSFCSGVAFPSLAETFVADAGERTASAAPFYAFNLLGASLGVACGGVWLPMWLGMSGAVMVAAAVQLTGGLIASRIATRFGERAADSKSEPSPSSSRLGWSLLVASGVLSLAAQALLLSWARQVFEGSVYAMCGALGAFIGGLGLGALAAGAFRRRGRSKEALLIAFAGASAVGLFLLPTLGTRFSVGDMMLTAGSPSAMLLQALAYCSLVMLPLTFCLGGVFPLAWEMVGSSSRSEGRMMGRALALNKLGSALGAVVGLFIVLPAAGLSIGTCMIGWAYLVIALSMKKPRFWLAGVLGLGLWQTSSPPAHPGLSQDLKLIASSCGAYGPVAVVEDRESGSRQILLNSRQRLSGTRGALSSQLHQSWVPLMLCRKPERVITIGMAAGISAAAALDFPIKELQAVELVPEVVNAAQAHFGEWNHALFSDPRATVTVGDGRIVLAQSTRGYDAIICDLFFPAEEGTAHLYSRDFFTLARDRLNEDGVLCLWLPCYQLTPETAGIVVRGFLDVFPNAVAVRSNFDPLQPVVGLVGSLQAIPFSRGFFEKKLADPSMAKSASRSPFLRSPDNALLMLAGDLRTAEPGFGSFEATTDNLPIFAFFGPRQARGKERLIGFPFLDWIGKRFPRGKFPSCDLGGMAEEELHAMVRAGHFYFAAAASTMVLPGDARPEAVRQRQVSELLSRAKQLAPLVQPPFSLTDQ